MVGSTKIQHDLVAAEPWGAAFLREMDLVLAENVLHALRTGTSLHDDQLRRRVGYFCAPLDGGLVDDFVGVVRVPDEGGTEWARREAALARLRGKPRGTWAVLEMGGGYGGYMADGYGGVGTLDGLPFSYVRPTAPALNHANLYADTISALSYGRRREIEAEIVAHSHASHAVSPGTVLRHIGINGRVYSKVEYVGPVEHGRQEARERVKLTRSGVRALFCDLAPGAFLSLFGAAYSMPPAYQDPSYGRRLASLHERRVERAALAFGDQLSRQPIRGLSSLGETSWLSRGGAMLERPVYLVGDKPGAPSGCFQVRFGEAGSEVTSASLKWDAASPASAATSLLAAA